MRKALLLLLLSQVLAPAQNSEVWLRFWKMPLGFERLGERFVAHAPGYQVALEAGGVSLGVRNPENDKAALIQVKFIGGHAGAAEPLDPLPGEANYLIGARPDDWRLHIRRFGRVRFSEVYPGVDVICYGTQAEFEYDLAIQPGADLKRIRLGFQGVEHLSLSSDGDLVLRTSAGEVRHRKPAVYQTIAGTRQSVPARYVIEKGHEARIEVGPHAPDTELVIDPVVSFQFTFGPAAPYVFLPASLAVDESGSAYLAVTTTTRHFPVTPGAFQPVYGDATNNCNSSPSGPPANCGDVLIVKLKPDGSDVEYATYLGGMGQDQVSGIAVDRLGQAYVTGMTISPNFPTTAGAFQTAFRGPNTLPFYIGVSGDAFVAKLSPRGDALVYSTYLGGSKGDTGVSIAVNGAGEAYVTGTTYSADFPETPGAPVPAPGAARNVFITHLAADGSRLLGSMRWNDGADTTTLVQQGAIDAAGNVYATGYTYAGRSFVLKASPDDGRIQYVVHMANASAFAMQADAVGNVYVAGYVIGPGLTTTANALQPQSGGSSDAFISKLAPDGSVVYSTYFGGSQDERITALALDAAGNLYVAGHTTSYDFPFAGKPIRDCEDLRYPLSYTFVAKLNAAGDAVIFSTPVGGFFDWLGLAVTPGGDVFVAGRDGSFGDFPQDQPNPGTFIAKLSPATEDNDGSPQPACVINAAGAVKPSSNEPNVAAGPVSPGELITIFGSVLGPRIGAGASWDQEWKVPGALAGVRVLFDGVAAPLLYVSDRQINAVVPFGVATRSVTQMQVERDGVLSAPRPLNVAAATPGIFSIPLDGVVQAAALNEDFTLNSSANPAKSGSIVMIWVTGLGMTDPVLPDGQMNTLPLAKLVTDQLQVLVYRLPVEVLYAGPAPALVAGTMQINFRVPINYGNVQADLSLAVPYGSGYSYTSSTIAVAP
jgi:uncharacterized protein (TIGR03437 family)